VAIHQLAKDIRTVDRIGDVAVGADADAVRTDNPREVLAVAVMAVASLISRERRKVATIRIRDQATVSRVQVVAIADRRRTIGALLMEVLATVEPTRNREPIKTVVKIGVLKQSRLFKEFSNCIRRDTAFCEIRKRDMFPKSPIRSSRVRYSKSMEFVKAS
jgi:hypothetical protein